MSGRREHFPLPEWLHNAIAHDREFGEPDEFEPTPKRAAAPVAVVDYETPIASSQDRDEVQW